MYPRKKIAAFETINFDKSKCAFIISGRQHQRSNVHREATSPNLQATLRHKTKHSSH